MRDLKQYADPKKGSHGAASSKKNLAYWSDRASANSKIAPRASDSQMQLPNNGKTMTLRETGKKPIEQRKIDRLMAGKDDLNNAGSSYMRGIRRHA